MKKIYTGLKAEKVDFGNYNMIAASIPASCIKIVANLENGGVYGSTQQCVNNPSTTFYWYIGDREPGLD